MTIRRHMLWTALVITSLAASPASAQFFNATIFISPCQMNIPVLSTATFTVQVCLEGEITSGAVAGDFRINGLPSGWITVVRPNPAAQSVSGNLFSDSGARIVFPSCQTATSGTLLDLFSFDLTPTDNTTKVLLNVAASIPPGDPNMNCAVVTGCQSPIGTKVCVNGFGTWINGGGCPLAVEPRTWSRTKALYE